LCGKTKHKHPSIPEKFIFFNYDSYATPQEAGDIGSNEIKRVSGDSMPFNKGGEL
jgi:hypothetical protein